MRNAPREVAPLVHAGICYEAPHWLDDGEEVVGNPIAQALEAALGNEAGAGEEKLRDCAWVETTLRAAGFSGSDIETTVEKIELDVAVAKAIASLQAELMAEVLQGRMDFSQFVSDPFGMIPSDNIRQVLEGELAADRVDKAMALWEKNRAALQKAAVRPRSQRGGHIVARSAETGQELWRIQLYTTKYDGAMEQDGQDVFITRLVLGKECLVVRTERFEEYEVGLMTGRWPASPDRRGLQHQFQPFGPEQLFDTRTVVKVETPSLFCRLHRILRQGGAPERRLAEAAAQLAEADLGEPELADMIDLYLPLLHHSGRWQEAAVMIGACLQRELSLLVRDYLETALRQSSSGALWGGAYFHEAGYQADRLGQLWPLASALAAGAVEPAAILSFLEESGVCPRLGDMVRWIYRRAATGAEVEAERLATVLLQLRRAVQQVAPAVPLLAAMVESGASVLEAVKAGDAEAGYRLRRWLTIDPRRMKQEREAGLKGAATVPAGHCGMGLGDLVYMPTLLSDRGW